ncbi:MAG TPA: LacI family DNA-binding transcriptional regulator [Candidatus Limnocylindrales bacterium]|nr:LacI family DNA-binding transcriptional regulator [Candidatus Limnocylindrales bacterium]
MTISLGRIYSPSRGRQDPKSPLTGDSEFESLERTLSTIARTPSVRATVTLRDVARGSGVSITTVSRILNGRESGVPIRDETRRRVLAVAAELGYKPNLLARGLRGSRSSLLGVIARDISDPFHIQILRGINAAAQARDYRLFLGHVDYRPDVALTYGSMFERSHADGIVIIGDIEGADSTLEVFAEQHRYVLGVTDRTARRQIPGVYGDSVVGTRLALEHLWNLGHRSIICVSDARTFDGRLRIDMYEQFMRDRGVGDRMQVHITDQEPEPSFELGRQIFVDFGDASPTAIFATSDTTAMGLMQAAFQAGIAMPDRLSIVGFDDIDFAAYTIPPLTTISQGGVEMGRVAAELLFDMIDNGRDKADVEDVILEPKLVVRGSTGAPFR